MSAPDELPTHTGPADDRRVSGRVFGRWNERAGSWAAGALLLGVTGRAEAQANYDAALIGGRSSLLGGTGVAAGTDAAAPLQNPATTVDILGTSFVFSTFFMQLFSRHVAVDRAAIAEIERGAAELNETQLRVLPNSTCLFADLARPKGTQRGAHKLSVCVAEPERQDFELASRVLAETVDARSGYQNRQIAQQFSKRVYAVGWAFSPAEQLSIGVTPMLQEVNFKDTETVSTLISEQPDLGDVVGSTGTSTASLLTKRASAFGLSALFGLRYLPARDWKMGVSLETPTLHLAGSYSAVRSSESTTDDQAEYLQDEGSARFTYPLRVALGLAGKLGKVGFETNAYVHTGRADFASVSATRDHVQLAGGTFESIDQGGVEFEERVRPVVNVGVGFEIPLSGDWSLLTGALTDFSGLAPRQTGSSVDDLLFRSRYDAIHASLGVSWTPRIGSILLGVRGLYGAGEITDTNLGVSPPERRAFEQTLWGVSLVISGQITLEMLGALDPTGLVEKTAGDGSKAGSEPAAK